MFYIGTFVVDGIIFAAGGYVGGDGERRTNTVESFDPQGTQGGRCVKAVCCCFLTQTDTVIHTHTHSLSHTHSLTLALRWSVVRGMQQASSWLCALTVPVEVCYVCVRMCVRVLMCLSRCAMPPMLRRDFCRMLSSCLPVPVGVYGAAEHRGVCYME
jgi:hypothetical protein